MILSPAIREMLHVNAKLLFRLNGSYEVPGQRAGKRLTGLPRDETLKIFRHGLFPNS